MNEDIVITKLIEILQESGVDVAEDEWEQPLDLDSLHYIALIVQIEESFDIMLDDGMLAMDEISVSSLKEHILATLQ